jgi:hypothetical protein
MAGSTSRNSYGYGAHVQWGAVNQQAKNVRTAQAALTHLLPLRLQRARQRQPLPVAELGVRVAVVVVQVGVLDLLRVRLVVLELGRVCVSERAGRVAQRAGPPLARCVRARALRAHERAPASVSSPSSLSSSCSLSADASSDSASPSPCARRR